MTTTTEPVTLEIVSGPDYYAESDGERWEHHAYVVRLSRGDRSMEVPWRAGIGITDDPTAADVLEALLSDAASIENARGDFEEWAPELGFDPDSRRAEAIFQRATKQTDELRELLGDDFDAAVFPPYNEKDPYGTRDPEAVAAWLAGADDDDD